MARAGRSYVVPIIKHNGPQAPAHRPYYVPVVVNDANDRNIQVRRSGGRILISRPPVPPKGALTFRNVNVNLATNRWVGGKVIIRRPFNIPPTSNAPSPIVIYSPPTSTRARTFVHSLNPPSAPIVVPFPAPRPIIFSSSRRVAGRSIISRNSPPPPSGRLGAKPIILSGRRTITGLSRQGTGRVILSRTSPPALAARTVSRTIVRSNSIPVRTFARIFRHNAIVIFPSSSGEVFVN